MTGGRIVGVEITDSRGRSLGQNFNGAGLALKVIDENGQEVSIVRDPHNRITSRTTIQRPACCCRAADVGIMYWQGQGVAQDRDVAVRWWRLGASQGNARAAARLKQNGYHWRYFRYVTLRDWLGGK